jgi:ABC-type polar amino acid transport system ATPase subunit
MIKIENLSYAYTDTPVLKNISFEIKENEMVGLLGLSGSGKTTLLKILSGLLQPDKGIYTIELNKAYENGKRNPILVNELGVVFQDYNLFMHLTVLDNLVLPYRLRFKKSKEESQKIAKELLSQFGLEEHLNKFPNECSGGQQQRIAIARALILNPRVLLIDEPTAALDQENTMIVSELLRDLNRKGLTVIVITHDLPFAQSICQRVIELKQGEIIQDTNALNYFKN